MLITFANIYWWWDVRGRWLEGWNSLGRNHWDYLRGLTWSTSWSHYRSASGEAPFNCYLPISNFLAWHLDKWLMHNIPWSTNERVLKLRLNYSHIRRMGWSSQGWSASHVLTPVGDTHCILVKRMPHWRLFVLIKWHPKRFFHMTSLYTHPDGAGEWTHRIRSVAEPRFYLCHTCLLVVTSRVSFFLI